MKLFLALSALCVAAAFIGGASAAPPAGAKVNPAKATLDFIAHEQAHTEAEASSPPPRPRPVVTTSSPPPQVRPVVTTSPPPTRRPGSDTRHHVQPHQQHHDRQNTSSSQPKKDWEPVSPSRPRQPIPTRPTYAFVVKNNDDVQLPKLPTTTSRSRVHVIPIHVEDGYTTTEASRWYDKLFGKATDVDDSPWGRRRRQATGLAEERPGAQREEVVIGSNAIRISSAARPPKSSGHSRPRGGQ